MEKDVLFMKDSLGIGFRMPNFMDSELHDEMERLVRADERRKVVEEIVVYIQTKNEWIVDVKQLASAITILFSKTLRD